MGLTPEHALDEAVRAAVYEHVIATGGPPDPADLAARLALGAAGLAASYRRLAEQRALVLGADGALVMAIPFAAAPTDVAVRAAGVTWWANCAFDGLGIPALLGLDAVVDSACPHSGQPITVAVRGGAPRGAACVLHMAVPLAEWWDNIGHT